ncbi:MAG: phospholipase [Bacteroidetes bacterium]|nr:phospholipase [Bacteroidota bacterium]
MFQKNIIVPKTARYFVLGEVSERTEEIWIVCHGYAQLANYFIRNFEILNDGKRVIVAPEGLHRFYWQGFSGRVVASWMTREDRLEDINDYCNFLDVVYNEVISSFNKNVKVNVLGFSQGSATVLRWLSIKRPEVNNLILWGGTFPADINFDMDRTYFNTFKTYFVMGTNDEYISNAEVEEQEKILTNNKINYKSMRFEGKHEIPSDVLLGLSKEL